MKKIILTCLVARAAMVSVSAANSHESSTQSYPPVTFVTNTRATVEYNVPNIISGDLTLIQFEKIYRLLPSEIQVKANQAYADITRKAETQSQFTYAGVKVKHTSTTWEFYYKGASIIVRNATNKDLFDLFGERDY